MPEAVSESEVSEYSEDSEDSDEESDEEFEGLGGLAARLCADLAGALRWDLCCLAGCWEAVPEVVHDSEVSEYSEDSGDSEGECLLLWLLGACLAGAGLSLERPLGGAGAGAAAVACLALDAGARV